MAIMFLDQKCSFESVMFLIEALQSFVQFSGSDLFMLEQEFLLLYSITLGDFPDHAKKRIHNKIGTLSVVEWLLWSISQAI